MKRILFFGIVIFFAACNEEQSAAPDLTVAQSIIEFNDSESTQRVYIASNTSWTSQCAQDWCKASILQKYGSDTVEIRVNANNSPNERTTYVSFSIPDGKIIKTIKVIQKGIPLRVLDSLTLIRFYEATNGANWTNHSGWKTSKLENWHGITIENDMVKSVKFENNNLSGSIAELANLMTLDTVSIVSERGITDAFPINITQLTNLRYLNFTGTSISGNIPAEIGNMTNLKTLILSSNPLLNSYVQAPAQIGQLVGLTRLELDSIKVDVSLLANLTNLEYLSLDSCDIRGNFPTTIQNLINLKYLSLNNNRLNGDIENIPQLLTLLTKLETLILSYNRFTGEIPEKLKDLPNLKRLELQGNFLEGALPEAFFDKEGIIVCPQIGTNFTNHPCP